MIGRIVFSFFLYSSLTNANEYIPTNYTELLDYVTMAPDQGESGTCLYVASTGAMELLANRRAGIKDPLPYGKFDLAESFVIHAPEFNAKKKYFWEVPLHKFNRRNYGIHINYWPFDAWDDTAPDSDVWDDRNWQRIPKVPVPKVTTIPLFVIGNKWSTNVLNDGHVIKIKEALWKHRTPIMVNYNDNGFWHVVLIVGYDDEMPGTCYEIPDSQCRGIGSFYVRDHFGIKVEIRDFNWFREKGNAAFIVKEVK